MPRDNAPPAVQLTVRIPAALFARIDAHVGRKHAASKWSRYSRTQAVVDAIAAGLDVLAAQDQREEAAKVMAAHPNTTGAALVAGVLSRAGAMPKPEVRKPRKRR